MVAVEKIVNENQIDLNNLSPFKICDVGEFEDQNSRYPLDVFDDIYYENYKNENIEDMLVKYVRNHVKLAFKFKS